MDPEVSSVRLDHLGLPAVMAHEIGLVDTIDALVGVDPRENLSTGQAVLAMCLNALGFTSKPLYMNPLFFKRRDIKFLLGTSKTKPDLVLKPEHLNEHKLGRTLDKIAEIGPDKLFMTVAVHAFRKMGVKVEQLLCDTTTHSFWGAYEDEDGNPKPGSFTPLNPDEDPITIYLTRGYSKDFRKQCKQIVQELLVSADGDVPLLFKAHSGNANDSVIMQERLAELRNQLKSVEAEDLMPEVFVADCKMYCEKSVTTFATEESKWVTRIPENVNEVKELTAKAIRARGKWQRCSELKKEAWQEFEVDKWGVKQRFIVVRTEGSKERANKNIDRQVKRERGTLEKNIKELRKRTFSCKSDLEKALNAVLSNAKYHYCETFNYSEDKQKRGRGRPRDDAARDGYERQCALGDVPLVEDKKASRAVELANACFVVGTNASKDALPAKQVLRIYLKDQQGVERSFRFLKNPQYFVEAFFLKNPSRVVALLTIMTLALLLHSLLQRKLRNNLAMVEQKLSDQKGKLTSRPTLCWVNQNFEGIDLIKVVEGDKVTYTHQAFDDFAKTVLEILGPQYQVRYSKLNYS